MIDFRDVDIEGRPQTDLVRLGAAVMIVARILLRLVAVTSAPAPAPSRQLDPTEAALIAGMSRRLLLEKTRGLRFRNDITRKTIRFAEDGLRSWLSAKGRR